MAFRVLIVGGTGQVGAAVVRALAAEPSCAEVVMVNRRANALTPSSLPTDPRVRQVMLDTASAQFPAEVTRLAQGMVAQGDAVYGASCVGVGKGSMKWERGRTEGPRNWRRRDFARGCHAGGITFLLLPEATADRRDPRDIAQAPIARCRGLPASGAGHLSIAAVHLGNLSVTSISSSFLRTR